MHTVPTVVKTALVAIVILVGAALAGGSAAAPSHLGFSSRVASAGTPQVSSNWAGYAAIAPEGATLTFANVTGTWVVPRVTCTASRADAVAFWVGLGGYSDTSQSLQQLGTAAECDGVSSTPTYYAWWEIVPAAAVTIPLNVKPGDTVNAAVAVSGQRVAMSLKNLTRHGRFSKVQTVSQALDISSAEWIAEAPASCTSTNRCHVVPLTNFGGVTFSNIAATGNDLPGTLSGPVNQPTPVWVATPITLIAGNSSIDRFFFQSDPLGPAVGAVPGTVSADGRTFAVSWKQTVQQPAGG